MNIAKILLRVTFGLGIIADAYMAIKLIIFPYLPVTIYRPENETVASLMIGWTILLVWAFIKPIERKFILLLTIIMMSIGRIIDLIIIITGKVEFNIVFNNSLPVLIILTFFIITYLISEIVSNNKKNI